MQESTGSQPHRLAMGGFPVCLLPGRPEVGELGGIHQIGTDHQPLQRSQPKLVVTAAVLGDALLGSARDLLSQGCSPRTPRNGTGLDQLDCEGEGLGLPVFPEDRFVRFPEALG